MEFVGLIIFCFIVYETIKLIIPFNPFTANTSFMTGFWTYIWSTRKFKGVIKIIILIILLLFFISINPF